MTIIPCFKVLWQGTQSRTSGPTQDHYTYAVTSELSVTVSPSLSLCRQTAGQPVGWHGPWKGVGPLWDKVSSKTQCHRHSAKFTTTRDITPQLSASTKLLPARPDWTLHPYLGLIFFLKVFWEKHKHSPCSPVLGVGLSSTQLRRSTASIR